MTTLAWITAGGVAMSAVALAGAVTLALREQVWHKMLLPMVALAAGTLLGGALFHLLPAAVDQTGNRLAVYVWVLCGFLMFFGLEQVLGWHHCHSETCGHAPLTYLVLAADTLHNFVGGLAVGGAFLADTRLGVSAWIAAAAHEVPQELGDFAVMVRGGWTPGRALWFNWLSSLLFLAGGVVAYWSARVWDVAFLLPFAAGNFLYIGAADLIPEVKYERTRGGAVLHFVAVAAGLAVLLALRLAFD